MFYHDMDAAVLCVFIIIGYSHRHIYGILALFGTSYTCCTSR